MEVQEKNKILIIGRACLWYSCICMTQSNIGIIVPLFFHFRWHGSFENPECPVSPSISDFQQFVVFKFLYNYNFIKICML